MDSSPAKLRGDDIVKLEIKVYSSLCSLEVFTVNGIQANSEDFVDKYDQDPDSAEPYGCGDMQAVIRPCKQEILDKYGITTTEYPMIAAGVAEKLSFGSCGRCI